MPDLSATRRDVLASIAVIAADISGGGGDVADPIADLQIKYYRGPFSERPNAGVENRVYETDAGAIYYDDGSSWTLVDRELNSLQIDGGPTVEAIDSNAVDQNGTLVGGGGGSSEWEVNGDGELVPIDDEPINVQSVSGIADHIVTNATELVDAFQNLSQGDTVVIASGTFTYSTGLEINVSDVTIKGAGMGATTLQVDGSANIHPLRIGNNAAVEDIRLEGFTIDGNEANHSGPYSDFYHGIMGDDVTRCSVERVEVKETFPYSGNDPNSSTDGDDTSGVPDSTQIGGGSGILFRGNASNVRIKDCYTHDCGWRGIDFWGDLGWVIDCRSLDNHDRGISGNDWLNHGTASASQFYVLNCRATGGDHIAAAIAHRDGGSQTVFANNKITAWTDNSEVRRGIVVKNIDGATIRGNEVNGAYIQDEGYVVNGTSTDVSVTENWFYVSTASSVGPRGAILISDDGSHISVSENIIILDDVITPGSNTDHSFGQGIRVDGTISDVSVDDNEIYVTQTGTDNGEAAIALFDSVADASIQNNHAEATTNDNAIELRDAVGGVTISANTVTTASGNSGIGLQHTGGLALVFGNHVHDCGAAGIFAGSFGSNITVPNCFVGFNLVENCSAFGIRMETDMDWWNCAFNVIVDNGDSGILVEGSNGLVAGNIVRGSSHGTGIEEASGASGVDYRNNRVDTSITTPWSLSGSGATFLGNRPRPTFDAAPSSPVNYQEYVATSSWDPDGDSNGEVVMTDNGGTAWQEVVDLPNT